MPALSGWLTVALRVLYFPARWAHSFVSRLSCSYSLDLIRCLLPANQNLLPRTLLLFSGAGVCKWRRNGIRFMSATFELHWEIKVLFEVSLYVILLRAFLFAFVGVCVSVCVLETDKREHLFTLLFTSISFPCLLTLVETSAHLQMQTDSLTHTNTRLITWAGLQV